LWYKQPLSVYLSLPVLFTVVLTVLECVPLSPSVVEGEKGSRSMAVGTTVHYRGREMYTLEDCEYYSTLQRERKIQCTVVPTTLEGEPFSPSVVYRGTNSPRVCTSLSLCCLL
jgi:hypothetical protein